MAGPAPGAWAQPAPPEGQRGLQALQGEATQVARAPAWSIPPGPCSKPPRGPVERNNNAQTRATTTTNNTKHTFASMLSIWAQRLSLPSPKGQKGEQGSIPQGGFVRHGIRHHVPRPTQSMRMGRRHRLRDRQETGGKGTRRNANKPNKQTSTHKANTATKHKTHTTATLARAHTGQAKQRQARTKTTTNKNTQTFASTLSR